MSLEAGDLPAGLPASGGQAGERCGIMKNFLRVRR